MCQWQALSLGSSAASGQSMTGRTSLSRSADAQSSYENGSAASATLQSPSYNSRGASSSSAVDVTAVRSRCPLTIMKACSVCYHSVKKLSGKRATGNRCTNGHDWDAHKVVYVVVSSKKVVRRLPQRKRSKWWTRTFQMCKRAKKDCRFSSNCRFAHSTEEIKLWTWMEENEGKSLLFIY